MQEQGKISRITNDIVTVELQSDATCAECGAEGTNEQKTGCKSCSVFQTQKRYLTAVNRNNIDLKVGDEIIVNLSPAKAIKAGFLIFIVPLLLFLGGYLVTGSLFSGSDETAKLLIGFCGLFAGFAFIFIRSRISGKKDWPVVDSVIHKHSPG